MLNRYGVEYSYQNYDIFQKHQKAACRIKIYKNTNIYYRGSYELDFLQNYYEIYPNIQNAPSIKYVFKGKKLVYHPDFYIPSLNLIVEIKNSYLAKKYSDIINAKQNATIISGYNYIMIVNKNYEQFEKINKIKS